MTNDPSLQGRPGTQNPEGQSFDPKDPNVIHGTKTTALILLMIPFVCVLWYFDLHDDQPRWFLLALSGFAVYYIVCFVLRHLGVKVLSISDLFHEYSHWVGAALLNLEEKSLRLDLFPLSPSNRFPHKIGNPHLSIRGPVSFREYAVVALFPIFTLLAATALLTLAISSASVLWWLVFSVLLLGSANDVSWVIMIIERKGTQRLVVDHGNHLVLL